MNPSYTNTKYYFENPVPAELFDKDGAVWGVLSLIEEYVKEKVGKRGVIIGEGTLVEEGAVIMPPTVIGKNCVIRAGTYIRGNVIIGDNCIIRAEMKNVVMMDNSAAAHLSYIGDSIIGRNCNLGAGSVLSNFRFDGKNITLKLSGEKIDSGLQKFGAIIGDGSHVGCNAVLNPGTVLGKECRVYPLLNIGGFFESGKIVKERSK